MFKVKDAGEPVTISITEQILVLEVPNSTVNDDVIHVKITRRTEDGFARTTAKVLNQYPAKPKVKKVEKDPYPDLSRID